MFIQRVVLVLLFSSLPSLLSAAQIIPVTVQQPLVQSLTASLQTVGQIESLQSPLISAQISAQVIDILVNIGDLVEPGTVLAKLDTQVYTLQVKQAQAEVDRLEAQVKLQTTQVGRYQQLLKTQGIDKASFDKTVSEKDSLVAQRDYARAQLQQAQLTLSQGDISSSITGIVDERMISLGDYVTPGKPMFKLVGNERLRVRLPFSEIHLKDIQVGQTVRIFSAVLPAEPLMAQINYLRPRIDSASRAIEVFASFQNPAYSAQKTSKNYQAWLPGGSVNAELILQEFTRATVLPQEAIVERPAGAVVYVVAKSRTKKIKPKLKPKELPVYTVEERKVMLGLRTQQGVQILQGLQPDDWIVVDGARFLTGGAQVQIAKPTPEFEQSMTQVAP